MNYVVVFFVSLFCISFELFLTRILNLKAWNHVVYTVIPFAILGYGIGANIQLIFEKKIHNIAKDKVVSFLLFLISIFTIISTFLIIRLPIKIESLVNVFNNTKSILSLLFAYTLVMLPFVFVGFLVVYYFSLKDTRPHKLYCFDLIGAGLGAILFFPLIIHLNVVRTIYVFAAICFFLGLYILAKRKKSVLVLGLIGLVAIAGFAPEYSDYVIDKKKGWEWIPGFFKESSYEQISSRWHPLGRTDIYRALSDEMRDYVFSSSPGTFEINVKPYPEFAYLSTNFLAGTPCYRLGQSYLDGNGYKLELFSQPMEAPYVLLENPKVFVIGAGGGRDIFMAKTHGATEVLGAEINPGIVDAMSKGGELFEYSGGIYEQPNVKIHKIDGRHLIKNTEPNSFDLIVLNGVDTFSGLSSGAYAYAESYLYTKDAIKDYLRILNDGGMINFNRWLFADMPRETLRLEAIVLEALRENGATDPWNHIIIGTANSWSLLLIKKTPFTKDQRQKIDEYFKSHDMTQLYPLSAESQLATNPLSNFQRYAVAFALGKEKKVQKRYPYDISVITDDNPFFYKYYKLRSFNPFRSTAAHHTGTVIFLTQFLVLIQAIVFILIFIFLPLFILRKDDVMKMGRKMIVPFVIFFSCLGVGFMFFEISIMQRFVLLLGSPIHSISIVLAMILISAGIGSGFVPKFKKYFKDYKKVLTFNTFVLSIYTTLHILFGVAFCNYLVGFSFPVRILSVLLMLLPFGFLLGMYFPIGMDVLKINYSRSIAWAWGINCGFSVLGSILAIIFAQFFGFNFILLLALLIYFIGLLAFRKMIKNA